MFDTLLDETSILGLALGAAVSGFLPVPEIQYLAYLHNAEDQLRGEAATLQFFSQGQYRNGMVIRIAGLGYQKGFGGHFHNDDAVGGAPRHPRDRDRLAGTARRRRRDAAHVLAAARVDGTVCVFLEPIALYHTRDLHEDGDERLARAGRRATPPLGAARVYGDGRDLTHRDVGERPAHVAARRAPARGPGRARRAWSTSAGWRRSRSTTSCARPPRRAACSSSTRRVAPAASRRASWPSLVDAGFDGRARPRGEQGLASSRSATPSNLVLAVGGRDRGGCTRTVSVTLEASADR